MNPRASVRRSVSSQAGYHCENKSVSSPHPHEQSAHAPGQADTDQRSCHQSRHESSSSHMPYIEIASTSEM